MARPRKQGADWFRHDVDLSSDEKVQALEAVFGNDGYAVYCKVLERMYRAGGTLDLFGMTARPLLAKACNMYPERFNVILDHAVRHGLFYWKDEEAAILSSHGAEKRLADLFNRRNQMADLYRANSGKGVSSAETPISSAETKGVSSAKNGAAPLLVGVSSAETMSETCHGVCNDVTGTFGDTVKFAHELPEYSARPKRVSSAETGVSDQGVKSNTEEKEKTPLAPHGGAALGDAVTDGEGSNPEETTRGVPPLFQAAWEEWPGQGTKRAAADEYREFLGTIRRAKLNPSEILPLLLPAAKGYADLKKAETRKRGHGNVIFKNLRTWIRERGWTTNYGGPAPKPRTETEAERQAREDAQRAKSDADARAQFMARPPEDRERIRLDTAKRGWEIPAWMAEGDAERPKAQAAG